MRMSRFFFLIGQGFKNIFTHGFMSFASVAVITACLFIMGCFSLLTLNIDNMIAEMQSQNRVIAYVDENCVYHGGIIAPGVGISLDALTSRGALLPAVELRTPQKAICTNTADCIRSGIMNGTACMLDGMIDKFMREAGKTCKVVATGGLAPQMIPNCTHDILYDETVILDGLRSIYRRNQKDK